MKRTDIAMIILIASLSAFVAYFVAISIPALRPPEDAVKVKTIDRIESDVAEPDQTVFNSDAINPTIPIEIGKD